MFNLSDLTAEFVAQCKRILGDNLVGVYLHGSAVMGCFNETKSDVDLLVVVRTTVSNDAKSKFMDMVVALNAYAPQKGIELSIVKQEVCKPFIYPTPFELHFSIAHLEWYRTNPADYIARMNGTDKDLAAHFTIIYYRGKCLYGKEIKDFFEKVDKKSYFDSIWFDIEDANEDILDNPTYIILNLCRVLAYKKDELILSKQEGGKWGLANIPESYHKLIIQALDDYSFNKSTSWDTKCLKQYATYMLEQIKE